MKLPTLYKEDQIGNIRQWDIECKLVKGVPRYVQTHGLLGGKLQTTFTEVIEGKNIGRANETSAWEQCCAEAQSLWNKQKDRKSYSECPNGFLSSPPIHDLRPMLAKSYNVAGKDLNKLKDGRKIQFPCYGQPKLDGIRCVAHVTSSGIRLYSRQQKEFTSLKHIIDALDKLSLPDGTIFDGELYIHGEEFQGLTSAIKRDTPSANSAKIEYHIYDLIIKGMSFKDREAKIAQLIPDDHDILKHVYTFVVLKQKDVERHHSIQIKRGYEGIMLRNITGTYKCGGRSADLQKVKKFMDMEFEIVGAYENKGKMRGQCTFICTTSNGDTFGVKPEGSDLLRKQYWADWQAGKLMGKMLTVRFFAWTTSKNPVPRFPVGISIRDYE